MTTVLTSQQEKIPKKHKIIAKLLYQLRPPNFPSATVTSIDHPSSFHFVDASQVNIPILFKTADYTVF